MYENPKWVSISSQNSSLLMIHKIGLNHRQGKKFLFPPFALSIGINQPQCEAGDKKCVLLIYVTFHYSVLASVYFRKGKLRSD
jgi:hypothetical protein